LLVFFGFIVAVTMLNVAAFLLAMWAPRSAEPDLPRHLHHVSLAIVILLVLSPLILFIAVLLKARILPGDGRILMVPKGADIIAQKVTRVFAINAKTPIGSVLGIARVDRLPALLSVLSGDLTLPQALAASESVNPRDIDEGPPALATVVLLGTATWLLMLHPRLPWRIDGPAAVVGLVLESGYKWFLLVLPACWCGLLLLTASSWMNERRFDSLPYRAGLLVVIPAFYIMLLVLSALMAVSR
jgi:hypothetical protein